MPLSPEQKAKVEQIMNDYRRELDAILSKHKQDIQQAIDHIDARKSEELRKLISSL